MTQQEKLLYHQIHPAKLLADWIPGLWSIAWMWHHRLKFTMIATFVPAIIASTILIRTADLETYKRSSAGRYLNAYMTPEMQALRMGGMFVIWIGAWYHRPFTIGSGLLMIFYGWFNGLLFPKKS